MTPETRLRIQQLLDGETGDGETVTPSSLDPGPAGDRPALLVVLALVGAEPPASLGRAQELATTSRDRQLVAIATAHLAGDVDRVDALTRDHLVDHPDSPVGPVLAWMAAHPRLPHGTPPTPHRPLPHRPPPHRPPHHKETS